MGGAPVTTRLFDGGGGGIDMRVTDGVGGTG
jgi:hypothetical protein